jgi:hypothetical protein
LNEVLRLDDAVRVRAMLWCLGRSVWVLIAVFLQALLQPACSIIRGIDQASTLACARCSEADACRLQLCVVRRKEKDQKFPSAAGTVGMTCDTCK